MVHDECVFWEMHPRRCAAMEEARTLFWKKQETARHLRSSTAFLTNQEADLPTALPAAFCNAILSRERSKGFGVADDRDLVVVAAFTSIGLFVTFVFTVLFPAAGNAVALTLALA